MLSPAATTAGSTLTFLVVALAVFGESESQVATAEGHAELQMIVVSAARERKEREERNHRVRHKACGRKEGSED